MNQSRVALAAIATLIPLAMIATAYSGRPALQDRQQQEKITVVASFYPLYEFASRVVGDRAEVSSLVPAGVEPHDWEPTAEYVSRARTADVLVINGAGFERWADEMQAKVVANTSEGIEFNYREEKEAGDDEQGNADTDQDIRDREALRPARTGEDQQRYRHIERGDVSQRHQHQ